MDTEYIKTHDVLNRYVLGQLDEKELVEFELYYLEHPEVLQEVELIRALKAGLQSNLDEQGTASEPGTDKGSLIQTIASWFEYPIVLTGNFALIALLATTLLISGEPDTPLGYSATRAWVGDVRGERAPLEIELNAASLVLDIDVAAPGTYSVTLLDSTGQPVTRIRAVESSADAVMVVFDASRLPPGTYQLTVSDPDNSAVVQRDLIIRSAL